MRGLSTRKFTAGLSSPATSRTLLANKRDLSVCGVQCPAYVTHFIRYDQLHNGDRLVAKVAA